MVRTVNALGKKVPPATLLDILSVGNYILWSYKSFGHINPLAASLEADSGQPYQNKNLCKDMS
jgi:hypothetical protein